MLSNCEDFGTRIRNLREREGLSLKALSSKLHIGERSLSNYETGKTRRVRSENLVKFAKFYHVSCDFLLGLKNS